MDAVAIAKVLEGKEVIPIAVLISIGAVPLVKGLFAVITGRHQRRKEFLEFWKEDALRNDDLWLEEVIQHRYGATMPARLIRHVAKLEWPSRKLRKVAMVSEFFEFDETQKTVAWAARWRGRAHWLEVEMVSCLIGYFVLAPVGIGLILTGYRQNLADGFMLFLGGGVFAAAAFKTFWHFISLVEARSTFAMVNGDVRPGFWTALRRMMTPRNRNRLPRARRSDRVVRGEAEEPNPM
ncbi:hypothetical protein L3067_16585 [Xanthomonas sp. PPL568]|uniref:hypothetical protein n=1 Tax=Xanthomonas indica TaxID=2912242 RepID=UPI001F595F90|nr:hypothetical protein [Xanthomonas indica]MCI2246225.1 hypothetical protein [Xanthomonas indica]